MDADRNPSPPPEFLDVEESLSGDRISGTVFSRQWVFQCLLNAIKVAENESTAATDSEGEAIDAVELDKEVEVELCTLWDMSANSDVAHFLQEFKASEIFLQVISTSKSPRMVEILVGILANMAVFPDLSLALSQQSDLLRTALYLLGSTDTPTLIQVVRLCHACLTNEDALKMWLDAIKQNNSCLSDVQFILSNCLNGEVLRTFIQALDCLLDQDSELCTHCSNADFVNAICVAASQLSGSDRSEIVGAFWHLLHSLDYENKIGHLLLEHREQLHALLRESLCDCCDTEHTLPSTQRCQTLAVILAVVSSLEDAAVATNQPSRFDDELKRMLESLYSIVHPKVNNFCSEAPPGPGMSDCNLDETKECLILLDGALTRILRACAGKSDVGM